MGELEQPQLVPSSCAVGQEIGFCSWTGRIHPVFLCLRLLVCNRDSTGCVRVNELLMVKCLGRWTWL